jgi:phospholipase C
LAVAACSSGGSSNGGSGFVPPQPGGPPPSPPPRQLRERIKHVVILVQENRSFDNLFHGFRGARYATFGYTHDGTRVRLQPASLMGPDIFHGWHEALSDWDNGRMDGFDLNRLGPGGEAGDVTLISTSSAVTSSRTGRWRSSTRSPTTCFRRCSAAASARTST